MRSNKLVPFEKMHPSMALLPTAEDAATAFAEGHVPGTINIPLNKSFSTWAGWLVAYDVDIHLIADDQAAVHHAVRELALYRSLEARSAVRVKEGITEALEQVGYLEKVASSQDKLISEEAKIMESRLLLAGMCDPKNAERIGAWLKKESAVPMEEPPIPNPSPVRGEGDKKTGGKP